MFRNSEYSFLYIVFIIVKQRLAILSVLFSTVPVISILTSLWIDVWKDSNKNNKIPVNHFGQTQ